MGTKEVKVDRVIDHLKENKVFHNVDHVEKVNVGSGGAQLFMINDSGNEYILKTSSPNIDPSLLKEYKFYAIKNSFHFIPEIIHTENHLDYGVIIVMKKYKTIKHEEWDYNLQLRAIDLCAKLNSMNKDKFTDLGIELNLVTLNGGFLKNSYDDWKYIVNKHNGDFDMEIVNDIYKNLDIVCPILNNGYQYICHGDFHPENILFDNDGNLIICDWQNIKIGKGIGDISFFIDRAIGFGINVNTDKLIEYYCMCLSKYTNSVIEKDILLKEKSAAALLSIFSFWAYYLKESDKERIFSFYDEMVNSFRYLQHNK